MKKVIYSFLSICLALQYFAAGVRAESSTALKPLIDQLVRSLAEKDETKGMRVGISVFDLTKNQHLYQAEENKTFVPASVHKLLVSAAALDKLGTDYQYRTEIYMDGKINEGILNGDLIIKGYGDPSLSEVDLQTMVQQLVQEKGIQEIRGDILLDESYFDTVRLGRGWTWDDERWYYSAPNGALSVERNRVKLTIRPEHNRAVIQMEPQNGWVQINNQVQMVKGNENKLQFDRAFGSHEIDVYGNLGQKAATVEEELSIDEPAHFLGVLWKKQLAAQGVKWTGAERVVVKQQGQLLLTHLSKPLSELVRHLNKESDNFYAEMFLKTLGAVYKKEGSFSAGLSVVRDYLKKIGIPQGYELADGSGLSRYNQIAPEQMLTLLRSVEGKSYQAAFEQSLPFAGVDGTLKKRLIGTAATNNLHAKTGSMSGVSSIAGYVQAANGDRLAFSIFTNGDYHIEDARAFQDQVALLLTKYPELPILEGQQSPPSIKGSLATKIDPILDQEDLKAVTAGVIVQSLDGKRVYERNPNKLFTPATTTKLLMAQTALRTLGPNFKFKTEFYWDKKNLYIKGFGDPSIKVSDLDLMVSKLKEQGIKNFPGDLIIDESFFNPVRYPWGWSWDEESRGDHPEISALSIEEGAATFQYSSGLYPGAAADIKIVPDAHFIRVENQSVTDLFATDERLSFLRNRQSNHVLARGGITWFGFNGVDQISIHDPAVYFGTVLKRKLEEAGIVVNPTAQIRKDVVLGSASKVLEYQSKPLSELLTFMLKTNNNHYAEMITKMMGTMVTPDIPGEKGSTAAGVQLVYKQQGGETRFDLYDGSGTSHYNQLSPMQLTNGVGEMESMLPVLDGGVRGVSGITEGRSSFTGIVTNRNGERLIVCMVLNGYVKDSEVFRRVQKEIVDVLR